MHVHQVLVEKNSETMNLKKNELGLEQVLLLRSIMNNKCLVNTFNSDVYSIMVGVLRCSD